MEAGKLSLRQGNYEQAKDVFRAAVALSKELPGDSRVQGLHYLGIAYYRLGQYLEAEVLMTRRRHEEALSMQREALALREAAYGPEHREVATALNNLSIQLRMTGMNGEAEKVQLRALRILEKPLGPEHPELVWGLLNLARLYTSQRRFAEAEALMERCRRICEVKLGPEHPILGTVLMTHAEILRETRRKRESKDLERRAKTILRQHGEDNLLQHTIDIFAFQ